MVNKLIAQATTTEQHCDTFTGYLGNYHREITFINKWPSLTAVDWKYRDVLVISIFVFETIYVLPTTVSFVEAKTLSICRD